MAFTYRVSFKPEKRKDKNKILIVNNIPLMMDLSCRGRVWYNTGIRLKDIGDFDCKAQRLKTGKKALRNNRSLPASEINAYLRRIEGVLWTVFDEKTSRPVMSVQQLLKETRKRLGDEKIEKSKLISVVDYFESTVADWHDTGIITSGTRRNYQSFIRIFRRFLDISKSNLILMDLDDEILLKFNDFLKNEYMLTGQFASVYEGLKESEIPGKERTQNTVAALMKKLNALLKEAQEKGLININPFSRIPKRKRELIVKESYGEPVSLTLEELLKIVDGRVPRKLERVRDCFLLQTAIGCRIEDFHKLTWEHVNREDNFYYLHYDDNKSNTKRTGNIRIKDTPLVKFAADIIEKYKGNHTGALAPYFINKVSGADGYNKQIKELLCFFEINRNIIPDKRKQPVPLYEVATSKTARKTHVDITAKVELNKYISGLHEQGSKAVNHYSSLSLKEKFEIYCMAFHQPGYVI